MCIGQLHPVTIFRTGVGVSVVLVLSVIIYFFSNCLIESYFIMVVVTIIEIFLAIIFILNHTFV